MTTLNVGLAYAAIALALLAGLCVGWLIARYDR